MSERIELENGIIVEHANGNVFNIEIEGEEYGVLDIERNLGTTDYSTVVDLMYDDYFISLFTREVFV